MIKSSFFKYLCIVLLAVSTSGCALAITEELLGDNVATHDDDQSATIPGGNQGNF